MTGENVEHNEAEAFVTGSESIPYRLDGAGGKLFIWADDVRSPLFSTVNECWVWLQGYAAKAEERQRPPA